MKYLDRSRANRIPSLGWNKPPPPCAKPGAVTLEYSCSMEGLASPSRPRNENNRALSSPNKATPEFELLQGRGVVQNEIAGQIAAEPDSLTRLEEASPSLRQAWGCNARIQLLDGGTGISFEQLYSSVDRKSTRLNSSHR